MDFAFASLYLLLSATLALLLADGISAKSHATRLHSIGK